MLRHLWSLFIFVILMGAVVAILAIDLQTGPARAAQEIDLSGVGAVLLVALGAVTAYIIRWMIWPTRHQLVPLPPARKEDTVIPLPAKAEATP